MLRDVEQSRIEGKVINSMNSTFLTLIPKCEKPITFADFRPISLCNFIYKLISKIASIHLNPFLDKAISDQHYGFLKNRLIIEPVGIGQELLHSIKTKNLQVMVAKIDLVKAFDRIN